MEVEAIGYSLLPQPHLHCSLPRRSRLFHFQRARPGITHFNDAGILLYPVRVQACEFIKTGILTQIFSRPLCRAFISSVRLSCFPAPSSGWRITLIKRRRSSIRGAHGFSAVQTPFPYIHIPTYLRSLWDDNISGGQTSLRVISVANLCFQNLYFTGRPDSSGFLGLSTVFLLQPSTAVNVVYSVFGIRYHIANISVASPLLCTVARNSFTVRPDPNSVPLPQNQFSVHYRTVKPP